VEGTHDLQRCPSHTPEHPGGSEKENQHSPSHTPVKHIHEKGEIHADLHHHRVLLQKHGSPLSGRTPQGVERSSPGSLLPEMQHSIFRKFLLYPGKKSFVQIHFGVPDGAPGSVGIEVYPRHEGELLKLPDHALHLMQQLLIHRHRHTENGAIREDPVAVFVKTLSFGGPEEREYRHLPAQGVEKTLSPQGGYRRQPLGKGGTTHLSLGVQSEGVEKTAPLGASLTLREKPPLHTAHEKIQLHLRNIRGGGVRHENPLKSVQYRMGHHLVLGLENADGAGVGVEKAHHRLTRTLLYCRREPMPQGSPSPEEIECKSQGNDCVNGQKAKENASAKGYGITQHRTSQDAKLPRKNLLPKVSKILAYLLKMAIGKTVSFPRGLTKNVRESNGSGESPAAPAPPDPPGFEAPDPMKEGAPEHSSPG
jgi:hypothetical protein